MTPGDCGFPAAFPPAHSFSLARWSFKMMIPEVRRCECVKEPTLNNICVEVYVLVAYHLDCLSPVASSLK